MVRCVPGRVHRYIYAPYRLLTSKKEDPYKLVVLAKDVYRVPVTRADLFFADNRVSIVSGDEEGVIRIYEYDPHGMGRVKSFGPY